MPREVLADETLKKLLEEKLPLLKKLLASQTNANKVNDFIKGMSPSEVAYLIQYLDAPYRDGFIAWLKPSFDPEIFLFLADNVRADMISLLSEPEIKSILDLLESDDALGLLASLDEGRRMAVLALMSAPVRQNFLRRLSYPEHSAGRLMQQEVLTFCEHWTIKQSLEYIAHSSDVPHQFYDAFIVDALDKPVGRIPLSFLLKKNKNLRLQEVMERDIRPIPACWSQEEVAFIFRLYDLLSAPVVDENGVLLGLITADDVIDVIERKATEDLLHMGGVHSSDFYESVVRTSLSRLNWLIVTFINSLLTSLVINEFQATLQAKATLATLMPVAAAMGGNTGIQTTTIVIRALATKELSSMNMVRSLLKEMRVALLNGLIFAVLLSGVVFYWFDDIRMAGILATSVVFNMVWAGGAGTVLPVVISRMGFDPALSAGPLLTTTTDVIGYGVFLALAQFMM